jgi:G:T-mismatch repair DNA endonuclease (very short patch repair protein)
VQKMLLGHGWDVLTVWECQLKRLPQLTERIRRFLGRRE